jgi:hypothetical protein
MCRMGLQLAWKGFLNSWRPVYQAEPNAKRQLIDCQVLRGSGPRPWSRERTAWLAGPRFQPGDTEGVAMAYADLL